MPPGRPKKYLSDAERNEARKKQIRACVKAYRVRKALQRQNTAGVLDVSPSIEQLATPAATETIDDKILRNDLPDDIIKSVSEVCTPDIEEDFENELAALVASAYQAPSHATALSPPPPPLQVVSIDYLNLDPVFPGDSDERRLFHYFRTRGIEEMIMFESDFWSYSLLQAAYAEPAVKHAILTLASLHETFTLVPMGSSDSSSAAIASARRSKWTVFGMSHYNKALRQLTQLNDESEPNGTLCTARLPATLICCILFVCIDTLLGNEETALMHIRHAFRMLSDQHNSSLSTPSSGSEIGTNEQRSYEVWLSENNRHYVSYDQLHEVLQTLDVCSKSWLVNRSSEDSRVSYSLTDSTSFLQLVFPRPLNGLNDAQRSFELIFSNYWSIMGGFDTSLYHKGYSLSSQARFTISTATDAWWKAFDSLLSRLQWTGRAITSKQNLAILTMKVHMTIISISTKAGKAGDAIPTEYNDQLLSILSMCRIIVLSRRTYCTDDLPQTTFQLGPRTFRIGLGVIPALYWVAALCQDDTIRHDAYAILKMVSRGEIPLPHYASDVKE